MKNAHILCIETSGPRCSVAVSRDGVCISDSVTDDAWHHSQYLTHHISNCLHQADLDIKDLTGVATSHGPGSYTGLRVGASTAKGICYALDIPLLSIDTLKIIAQPLTQEISDDMKILATIDARRDEIYYNIYDKSLNELQKTESHILSPDSFLHYRSGGLYVTGDGTDKTRNILTDSGDESFKYRPSNPSAKYMSALAYKKYISKQFEDIAYYSPFYMKPPNITTRKKPLF